MTDGIYLANDNLLVVDGLKNESDGTYLNAASVTCTLVNGSGVPVSGQTWPLAMVYQAGSNGKYIGTLEDTLSLSEGQTYVAVIDADAGSGLKGHWEIPLKAKVRRQ